MKYVCRGISALAAMAVVITTVPAVTLGARQAAVSAPSAVPPDLKPLLASPASEMRMVVTRYQADRALLAGNYAGPSGAGRGGRRGGGAAPAAPPPPPVPLSMARLS